MMNTKLSCVALLAVVLPLSACVADGADAAADDKLTSQTGQSLSGGPWTWVDTATLKCLDSNIDGAVYALGCNGGAYQNWTNSPSTYGDRIIDQATGRCLDSNGNGNVYTLPCNGGAYQQWRVTYTGTFGFEIRNVATGFCLDSNVDGAVYTLGCNNGNYQRWR